MNHKEFYDNVAEWSQCRRQLENVNAQLTSAMLVIYRCERTKSTPSERDLAIVQELKSEKARLEFILNGVVDTLDSEVDRVEAYLKSQNN